MKERLLYLIQPLLPHCAIAIIIAVIVIPSHGVKHILSRCGGCRRPMLGVDVVGSK